MTKIDWTKAGKRIRWTKPGPDGRNPDWDWVNSRWKDEADYAGEALLPEQIVAMADCPRCGAMCGPRSLNDAIREKPFACVNTADQAMTMPHAERRRAAGLVIIEEALK